MNKRKMCAFAAGTLLSLAAVTGCSGTDESTPDSSPTAMQTDQEAGEQEVDPNITPEQNAFLADLLATPLPQDEATARIEEAGYIWRLGVIDGEPQAVTMDYRIERLTLTTQDGLVIDATWG